MIEQEKAITYAKNSQPNSLDELISFLRIPTISSLPENKQDIQVAAEWLSERLLGLGFDSVSIYPTDGLPIVYADYLKVGHDAPTILVYGHYDVQPVDPIDEWLNEPFVPDIRGENIFARGATDMKAQLIGFLNAAEAIIKTSELPVNLKFMLEGEEEVGSSNLEAFIVANKDLLKCDFCLNLDAGILAEEVPSIQYGLRGLIYFEIRIQGPEVDLHSGKFGGAIENPALILCELIAGMRDSNKQITLPNFYDNVRPLSQEERDNFAKLPLTDAWWLDQTGAKALREGAAYTPTERATVRPTLDVNGFLSGFTGVGSKTVLPAKAMAKISMRLVPDQDPEQIIRSLENYFKENMPPTVSYELEIMSGSKPSIVERDSEAVQVASRALEAVWNKKPLFARDGGSVPVVGLIQKLLGVDSLLFGFGLPDDNPHAPNEKQHLPTFYRGIETYIRFLFGFDH